MLANVLILLQVVVIIAMRHFVLHHVAREVVLHLELVMLLCADVQAQKHSVLKKFIN